MNQQQKTYLFKRIDAIAEEKKKSYQKFDATKYIKKLKPVTATEFLDFIKFKETVQKIINDLKDSNNLPLGCCNYAFSSIYQRDIFSNYDEVEKEYKEDLNEYDKLVREKNRAIDAFATEVKDKIMLGSEEEALRLLSEFQNKQF